MLLCKSAVSYFVFSSDISLTHFQHTLNSVYAWALNSAYYAYPDAMPHGVSECSLPCNKTSKYHKLFFTH